MACTCFTAERLLQTSPQRRSDCSWRCSFPLGYLNPVKDIEVEFPQVFWKVFWGPLSTLAILIGCSREKSKVARYGIIFFC